ncbi:MAG: alkaline phosphatase family protein [Acidimicrobiia bacterium]|nr:alkaline phosphatase family protein [Acidimicrobiia bacterium]
MTPEPVMQESAPVNVESPNGSSAEGMILPAYGRGCLTDLLPALTSGDPGPLPVRFGSGPRVLFVLDGLGWEQMARWRHLLPNLSSFLGDSITTVAPSTTASALTSITTSLPPSQHGIVGYRMVIDDMVFNTLRWGSAERPDCRTTVPPELIQPYAPFLGRPMALVTKAEFQTTGFSRAHLRGGRLTGYRTPAVLVHELVRIVRSGEDVVYAYYDGVDKVAHEYGLGTEYEAELAFVDRMVGDVVDALPSETTLVITADHGQVDCGDRLHPVNGEVLEKVTMFSGEARFRWLHCEPGHIGRVAEAAQAHHGHEAWIRTRDQILDEGWFGPGMSAGVVDRLGDVALLPFDPIGYADPADTGPFELVGRHGSLTAPEMLVPCVATVV